MNPSDSPERRADLLDRLQQTENRHDAAELDRQTAAANRADGEQVRILCLAVEELRAVVEETRQMNYEMRESFRDLVAELRRSFRS